MEASTLDPQTPEEDAALAAFEQGDYAGDLVLEGTSQLSFDVGGKKPTTSSLRLQGGKVEIEGQFEKGDRLVLHVELEVRGVEFRDEVDQKTGAVVGCARNHKAHVVGVERV